MTDSLGNKEDYFILLEDYIPTEPEPEPEPEPQPEPEPEPEPEPQPEPEPEPQPEPEPEPEPQPEPEPEPEMDVYDPVIVLNGSDTVYLELGNSYSDEGATATDYDGYKTIDIPITTYNPFIENSELINTVGEYQIAYTASDASGNWTTVTRTIIIQGGIPNISLEGSDQINYIIGDTYTDQGISGLSSSDSIEISLGFNSSDSYFFTGTLLSELDEEVNSLDIESQYIIQYLVTNIYGNINTVSRILNVTYPIPNISLEGSDQINYIIGDTIM